MLPHNTFANLRLHDFFPSVEPLKDWCYLGHYWVGEAEGFTSILQLEDSPEITRSIEVALRDLDPHKAAAILDALELPFAFGMQLSEIIPILDEPTIMHKYVEDRITHEFHVQNPAYEISCTIHEAEGLIHVTIHTPLPPVPED